MIKEKGEIATFYGWMLLYRYPLSNEPVRFLNLVFRNYIDLHKGYQEIKMELEVMTVLEDTLTSSASPNSFGSCFYFRFWFTSGIMTYWFFICCVGWIFCINLFREVRCTRFCCRVWGNIRFCSLDIRCYVPVPETWPEQHWPETMMPALAAIVWRCWCIVIL